MVATLWETFPGPALRIWAVFMLAMLLGRAALYVHYRRHAHDDIAVRHSRYFVLGAALSGLLWGIAGVVFFAPTLEYQLFILFILVGMGAGAVSSLTAYMPAFLAYFPISILPVAIVLLNTAEPVQVGLGMMTLAYVAALTFFARNISRSLAESWRLRFENLDLVRELSEQKHEAEQANLAKSRFLAAASHDLRQPLHALTLYVSLLDEAPDPARAREYGGKIKRSVDTLQNLFNALLDISKLEAGTLVPEPEAFPLQPMLDRLNNDFAIEAESRQLALMISPCDAIVYSDPILLEQILRNFLSNALRYTEQGEVRVETQRQQDGSLCIDVIDSGIGIDAAQQSLIFNEFYQVNITGRDRSEGLGLGLSIVARVAKLLGHPVAVQSQPGRGSLFSVCVPPGQASAILGDRSVDRLEQPPVIRPLRILLIDDDETARESTRTVLETWACEVIAAGSLSDAMRRLAGSTPDGVIADYRLAGKYTGLDAIHALRQRFGDLPGIIITGDVAARPLRALQESGLQLLHKPVPPSRLRAFVESVRRATAARLPRQPA